MTRADRIAQAISDRLLTGMHYSTPEGQMAIAAIVAEGLHARAHEQAQFWEDCLRAVCRDKDWQIAELSRGFPLLTNTANSATLHP